MPQFTEEAYHLDRLRFFKETESVVSGLLRQRPSPNDEFIKHLMKKLHQFSEFFFKIQGDQMFLNTFCEFIITLIPRQKGTTRKE